MGDLSDRCSGELGGGTDDCLFSEPNFAADPKPCSDEESYRFRVEKRDEAEESVDWGEDADCPFCGSPANGTVIDVVVDGSTGRMNLVGYYVACMWGDCGAFGPSKPTAQEAVDAWNKRKDA